MLRLCLSASHRAESNTLLWGFFLYIGDVCDRNEDRLFNAWQTLTNSAPGNSGKIEVIEFFYEKGQILEGVDLGQKRK